MKLAAKKFPEGLITGILPAFYGQKESKAQTQRSMHSAMSGMTNRTNMSTATKKNFEREDVESLNHYLDEILMPASNRLSSSRGSTRASNATVGSNASIKTLTSIHEKPFY